MPFWSSSYTAFNFSATASATRNGETQNWGHRSARETYRNEDNTRHERSLSQTLGEEPVYEERHYDAQGRQVIDDGRGSGQQGQGQGRIEDVSERKESS
jgi:hypothetical protein